MIKTPHGEISTPAFLPVGTNGSVKGVLPKDLITLGAEGILGNAYHLYLSPGHQQIEALGGLHSFMGFAGPIMTDSGGFQALSLGAEEGYNKKIPSLLSPKENFSTDDQKNISEKKKNLLAKITDEGVYFKSHRDGSEHFFNPEISMEIQRALGADIIVAFDEPRGVGAERQVHEKALWRTHEWAKRSLLAHQKNYLEKSGRQALYGVVQGGPYRDLREQSAKFIGAMDFAGFGIGGSYVKSDIEGAVSWVTPYLPEEKPRHLLGIGEPEDLLAGMAEGMDTFDCVSPTRRGRNGSLYTTSGLISIQNAAYAKDSTPIEKNCLCYACQTYSRSAVHHFFKVHEMAGPILGSIHNLYFIVNLVKRARVSILEGNFSFFRESFLQKFLSV